MEQKPRVAVVQDGARLHYAFPLALYRRGMLERAFCDWFSRPGSMMELTARAMRRVNPALGQRMLDRYEPGLKGAKIVSHPRLAMRILKRRQRMGIGYESEMRMAGEMARWALRAGFGNANAVFGFIRQIDPVLFEEAQKRGLYCVGDQIIAPYAIERAEELKQRARFPAFVKAGSEGPGEMEKGWIEMEERTWRLLSHITCASDYVREGLIAQGVAAEKITVNPYPVDTTHFGFVERAERRKHEPVTVGFVGSVNLRKGTPYFFEVAERFDPRRVKFVMIGPVGIAPEAAAKQGRHVELVGNVPRSRIPDWLGKFDLYFFPSTCEGSAGSITEAMASGLPVVTSPNSGAIVRHGESGFIHPYDAVDAYAEAIRKLAGDADLRLKMGMEARRAVEAADMERFGAVLGGIFERATGGG